MRPSSDFEAQYAGRCGICDGPIGAGDIVCYVDDELCHSDCADAEADERDDHEDLPL